MNPNDEERTLLQLSHKDLKAAMILAKAEEPQTEAVGFHLQQAVEKALKAWLLIVRSDYPKTHDLSHLLSELELLNQPVESYWNLVELNPFAVQFRYGLLDEEQYDWLEAYRLAMKLIEQIETMFSLDRVTSESMGDTESI